MAISLEAICTQSIFAIVDGITYIFLHKDSLESFPQLCASFSNWASTSATATMEGVAK